MRFLNLLLLPAKVVTQYEPDQVPDQSILILSDAVRQVAKDDRRSINEGRSKKEGPLAQRYVSKSWNPIN